MKKMKCIKCGLYYKDRKDPEDSVADKSLCWNCRFVWRCVGIMLRAWPTRIRREVSISLDDLRIRKIK